MKSIHSIRHTNSYFHRRLIIISAIMLAIVTAFGWKQGLWNDELATVGSLHLGDMKFSDWVFSFEGSTFNPYFIFARIWAEAGEAFGFAKSINYDKWLLLSSGILSAIACYFTGLSAREVKDENAGIVSACLYAFSLTALQVAMEFRYYPWLMCFMAISFYLFCRITKSEKVAMLDIALYGISMGCAVSAHFLNVFAFVALGLLDIILVIRKKKSIKVLYAYAIGVIIAIPFAVSVFAESATNVLYDGGDPTITALLSTIPDILRNNTWIWILFCFSIAYAIFNPRKNTLFSIATILPIAAILFNWIGTRLLTEVLGYDPNFFMTRYMDYLLPILAISVGCFLSILFGSVSTLKRTCLENGDKENGDKDAKLVSAGEASKKNIPTLVFAFGISVYLLTANVTTVLAGGPEKGGAKPLANWIIANYEEFGESALYFPANYRYTNTRAFKEMYLDEFIEIDIDVLYNYSASYVKKKDPKFIILDDSSNQKKIIEPSIGDKYTLIRTDTLPDFGRKVHVYERNDFLSAGDSVVLLPTDGDMITTNYSKAPPEEYIDEITGHLITSTGIGRAFGGPHWKCDDGIYNFTLHYEVLENPLNSLTGGSFQVTSEPSIIHAEVEVPTDSDRITIENVSFSDVSAQWEVKLWTNGVNLEISSITIERVG